MKNISVTKVAAMAFALALISEQAHAANATWNGATNANWATATNWSATPPPTTFDLATFNNNGNGNVAIVIDSGRNIKNITFATGAAAYTIGSTSGFSLFLTNGGVISMASTGNNQIINAPLIMTGAAYTFSSDTFTSSGRRLTIGGTVTSNAASGTTTLTLKGVNANTNTVGGVISDGTLAQVELVKDGSGKWLLTPTANTYTGATTISGGILNVASLANGGTASSIGAATTAASNLVLDGGTLQYTGTVARSTNRNYTLTTNGGEFDASGTSNGAVTFSGNMTASGTSGTQTLTLTGTGTGTSAGTLSGTINDGTGTNVTAVTKSGTGQWTLSGANTYTGDTTVSGGTLVLGNATNTLSNSGSVLLNGGTLALGTNSDTVGAVTLSSGSITGTGTLTGSSYALTDSGTISAKLGGSGVALTKTGSGSATLSGANTYTGATTVSGGTLLVSGTINASSAVAVNGGTLNYSNNSTALNRNIALSSGSFRYNSTLAYSGTLTQTGGSVGGSGNLSGTTLGGSGTVDPGNSPGILTVAATDPTGGLGYNFEFTLANALPTWNAPAASGNDVLRLQSGTPITAGMTAANTIGIYLNVASLTSGDVFTGGFYTDNNADFLSSISGANFQYYLANVAGGVTYNGINYDLYSGPLSFNLATISQSADFGAGSINGYSTQFTAVPEPSTYALVAMGLGLLWVLRRRKLRA